MLSRASTENQQAFASIPDVRPSSSFSILRPWTYWRAIRAIPGRVKEYRLAQTAQICPYCQQELRGKPKSCPKCGARIGPVRASRGQGTDLLSERLHAIVKPASRVGLLRGFLRRRQ